MDSLRTRYSGVDEFKSKFAKEFVKCTIKMQWKSANSYPVYSDLPVTQTRFDFPWPIFFSHLLSANSNSRWDEPFYRESSRLRVLLYTRFSKAPFLESPVNLTGPVLCFHSRLKQKLCQVYNKTINLRIKTGTVSERASLFSKYVEKRAPGKALSAKGQVTLSIG